MHNLNGGTKKMMLYDVAYEKYYTKKLKNTSNWDSKDGKNNQVSINLIDNAIIDYNDYIDNKIKEKLDNEIPHIDQISETDSDEYIECRIYNKLDVIRDFKKAFSLKYDSEVGLSNEIIRIMKKFSDEIFGIQHHSTSSFLKYDDKEPRADVLLKLQKISSEIEMLDSTLINHHQIKLIIEKALELHIEISKRAKRDGFVQ